MLGDAGTWLRDTEHLSGIPNTAAGIKAFSTPRGTGTSKGLPSVPTSLAGGRRAPFRALFRALFLGFPSGKGPFSSPAFALLYFPFAPSCPGPGWGGLKGHSKETQCDGEEVGGPQAHRWG